MSPLKKASTSSEREYGILAFSHELAGGFESLRP